MAEPTFKNDTTPWTWAFLLTSLLQLCAAQDRPFAWNDIAPSPQLAYHDCFSSFQCARLSVPLDWNNTASNDTFSIAMVRLPAKVPVTDPRYGGAVLVNPGGPGGSGVRIVLAGGSSLQVILDAAYTNDSAPEQYLSVSPDARYFDIIGFDPRGFSNSEPLHVCQRNQDASLQYAFARGNSILGTPEGRLDHLYNLEESLNLVCLYDPVTNPGGSKVANYMGTTSVARDMVEIVERHGQWREVRAQNSSEAVQERLRWNKGEEPLNYYGLSYGSLLGQTAAAMQPHRVSRFVLDGIDDPADWWSGRRDRSIVDADAVIGRFFADCALAGPSRCALYAGPSANDTRVRFQSLHDLVAAHSPIPVPGTARVLTLSDLQNQISDLLLYGTSTITWPIFATRAAALAAALSNATSTARINASALSPFLPAHPVFSSATSLPPDTPIDPLNPLSFTHPWASSLSATAPVTCGDTPLRRSKPQFRAWRAALRASNPLAADIWATQSLPCTTWPGRAAWSFAAAHPIASNATAHPLFFLSNVLDPITWSENARAGPQRFPGAAVLLDDAVGHTTVSAPSLCVARALRAYFQRGALPAPGTLCRPLARAFGITEGTEPLGGDATAAERAMAAASETLGVLLASL